jgi:hypothetical protein
VLFVLNTYTLCSYCINWIIDRQIVKGKVYLEAEQVTMEQGIINMIHLYSSLMWRMAVLVTEIELTLYELMSNLLRVNVR